MHEVVDFLRLLAGHEDREWFNANKALYRSADAVFKVFAAELIDGIAAFDDSVSGLSVADCTYRIYRDTRFSADKTPYKKHMGVFVAPHGKKAGYAGYYLHIEPDAECFLYAGLHLPSPVVLRSVREEIIDNGQAIVDAIEASNGFTLSLESQMKRTPAGFPHGHEFDYLLRLRDVGVEKAISMDDILAEDFLRRTLEDFRSISPFVKILNRAVQYAHEEMM